MTYVPAAVLETRVVEGFDPCDDRSLFERSVTVEPVPHPDLVAAFAAAGATRIGPRTWTVGLGKDTKIGVFNAVIKVVGPSNVVASSLAAVNGRAANLRANPYSICWRNGEEMQQVVRRAPAAVRKRVGELLASQNYANRFPSDGGRAYSMVVVSSSDTQLYFRVSTCHMGPDRDDDQLPFSVNLAPAGRTPGDAKVQRIVDADAVLEWAAGKGIPLVDPDGAFDKLHDRLSSSVVAASLRGRPARGDIYIGSRVPRLVAKRVSPSGERHFEADAAWVASLADEPRMVIDPLLLDVVRMSAATPFDDDRLRPYQRVAVSQHLATRYGYVNASVPGTGKTVMTLVAHQARSAERERWRGLVVADAALRAQWVAEAGRWFPEAKVVELRSKHDGAALADALNHDGPVLAVCSYPLASGVIDAEPGTLGSVLATCRFDDLCVDEATALRNTGTVQGQALWMLRQQSDVAVVLTGTPISRGLDDIGRLVAFARNKADLFDGVRLDKVFPDLSGAKAQQAFAAALGPIVFRRDKREVQNELPTTTVDVVRLTPTGAERNLARAAREELKRVYLELVSWVDRAAGTSADDPTYKQVRDSLTAARGAWLGGTTLARQACSDPSALAGSESAGAALLRGMGLVQAAVAHGGTKRRWLREYVVAQVQAGNPVLVFTEFSTVAGHLIADLRADGCSVGAVLGGGGAGRDRDIAEFCDGKIDVLVATAAGKRGLNLQRAKVVIQYDLPWTPEDVIQRTGRAERLGSTNDEIRVVFPLLTDTIDERVAAVVVARAERAMQALDLSRGVKAGDSDFGRGLSGLREAVEGSAGGRSALMELCAAVVAEHDA
jgi:hypothetical protein